MTLAHAMTLATALISAGIVRVSFLNTLGEPTADLR